MGIAAGGTKSTCLNGGFACAGRLTHGCVAAVAGAGASVLVGNVIVSWMRRGRRVGQGKGKVQLRSWAV